MLSFCTAAAIAAASTCTSIDPALRRLVAERVDDWTATGLLGLTHLLIVEPGDKEADFVREIGLSPQANPIDCARFGSEEFRPHWDYLERCSSCFEMHICVGNAGFSFVIVIPEADGVDPELLSLCRTYTDGESDDGAI